MRRAVVSILAIVSIILLPFICAAQAGKAAGAAGDDGAMSFNFIFPLIIFLESLSKFFA